MTPQIADQMGRPKLCFQPRKFFHKKERGKKNNTDHILYKNNLNKRKDPLEASKKGVAVTKEHIGKQRNTDPKTKPGRGCFMLHCKTALQYTLLLITSPRTNHASQNQQTSA